MPDQEMVNKREIVNLDFSVMLPDGFTTQEITEGEPFIFRAAGEGRRDGFCEAGGQRRDP